MARISKEVVPINDRLQEMQERTHKLSRHVATWRNRNNALGKVNAIRQSRALRKHAEMLVAQLNQLELDLESDGGKS